MRRNDEDETMEEKTAGTKQWMREDVNQKETKANNKPINQFHPPLRNSAASKLRKDASRAKIVATDKSENVVYDGPENEKKIKKKIKMIVEDEEFESDEVAEEAVVAEPRAMTREEVNFRFIGG